MRPSRSLVALIDACAPLWAGEAEVIRSYWDWQGRTPETDRVWLLHQTYKEFWDGFMHYFAQLRGDVDALAAGVDRRHLRELTEVVGEELEHYCLFADVYEQHTGMKAGSLDPLFVQASGNWPENVALGEARRAHREAHGALGARAALFSEGGYCTLYSEGRRLAGRSAHDDRIAAACAAVYEDEFDHMLRGIAGLDGAGLAPSEWLAFTGLVVEQLGQRIRMRNAQFGRPLSEDRVEALCAGRCEPLDFAYDRAGFDA